MVDSFETRFSLHLKFGASLAEDSFTSSELQYRAVAASVRDEEHQLHLGADIDGAPFCIASYQHVSKSKVMDVGLLLS